jgi:succinate dehydrogenase / fumarate reductase membrane anchor subunit
MATITTEKSSKQKTTQPGSATTVWVIQAVTGLLLILLLGLHMIAHHFIVEGGLRTYQDVLDYVSNPVIFVLEILFLIVVTPHAMLGLQGIVLDLGPSKSAERTVVWIFRILTVLILGYGIWLAVALQNA